MSGKGGGTKDVVAATVGAKVSENFWTILFASGTLWFGWLSAFESDLEAKVSAQQKEIADLSKRLAYLEGKQDQ